MTPSPRPPAQGTAGDALSNAVDPLTANAEWFVSGVEREEVKEMTQNIMKMGEVGDFLVRDVSSEPGNFGLSLKAESGLLNYLIERVRSEDGNPAKDKFRLRGEDDLFPTVAGLVYNYSVSASGIKGVKLKLQEEDLLEITTAIREGTAGAALSQVDDISASAEWFKGGVSREVLKAASETLVKANVPGSFIIREVASDPGSFALTTINKDGKLTNLQIPRLEVEGKRMYAIKGERADMFFGTLSRLVYHYATAEHGLLGQQLTLSDEQLKAVTPQGAALVAAAPEQTAEDAAQLKAQAELQAQRQSMQVDESHVVRKQQQQQQQQQLQRQSSLKAQQRRVEPFFNFEEKMTSEMVSNQMAVLRARKKHTEQVVQAEEMKLRKLIAQQAQHRAILAGEEGKLRTLQDAKWTNEQSVAQKRTHLEGLNSTRPKLAQTVETATTLLQGLAQKRQHVAKKVGRGQLAFEKLAIKRDQFYGEARSATAQLQSVEAEQGSVWNTLGKEREKLLAMQRKRQAAMAQLNSLEEKAQASRVQSEALTQTTAGLRDAARVALQEQQTLTELLISEELRLRTLWTGEKQARIEDRAHWTSTSEKSAIDQAREIARAEREARAESRKEQVRVAEQLGLERVETDGERRRREALEAMQATTRKAEADFRGGLRKKQVKGSDVAHVSAWARQQATQQNSVYEREQAILRAGPRKSSIVADHAWLQTPLEELDLSSFVNVDATNQHRDENFGFDFDFDSFENADEEPLGFGSDAETTPSPPQAPRVGGIVRQRAPTVRAASPAVNPTDRFANLTTMWNLNSTGEDKSAAEFESFLTQEQLRIQLLQEAAKSALDHVDGYLDVATDSE